MEIIPARAGDANHEAPESKEKEITEIKEKRSVTKNFNEPIFPNSTHWIPRAPCATKAKPTVAPTILCVPDTGKLKKVATSNQIQQPDAKRMRKLFLEQNFFFDFFFTDQRRNLTEHQLLRIFKQRRIDDSFSDRIRNFCALKKTSIFKQKF